MDRGDEADSPRRWVGLGGPLPRPGSGRRRSTQEPDFDDQSQQHDLRGFEKEQVVGVLLMLHDAGILLGADVMQGWALTNGWSGKNPGRLSVYARDINAGKRPRTRSVLRAD